MKRERLQGISWVGLHALAALYHHYLLRDNTLTRMLAGRRLIRPWPWNEGWMHETP